MEHFTRIYSNVSTCKSPQMFGSLAKRSMRKSWCRPGQNGSVPLCPARPRNLSANGPEMNDSGYQDVDYVLAPELARMIKEAGIDFKNLPEEGYDDPMGESTGAAVLSYRRRDGSSLHCL